jgi:chorismate dehydratase
MQKGKILIFGSISYLNLLPFQIYIKRKINNTQIKQIINYKKTTPSNINREFRKKKIDAAFISSIKSRGCRCTNLGIIANGAVYSVLVLPSEQMFDIESDTSNVLSKVLNIKGKVIIGDKALKYYLKNKNSNFIDLSLEWKIKTNLPFVFARLCYNKRSKLIKKIAKNFKGKREKIPQYYLKKAATQKGLSVNELKWYLNSIDYFIKYKEERALKLFFKKSKAL